MRIIRYGIKNINTHLYASGANSRKDWTENPEDAMIVKWEHINSLRNSLLPNEQICEIEFNKDDIMRKLNTIKSELNYVLVSNKDQSVKDHYVVNAISYTNDIIRLLED